ncbi:MAG: thioredoxin family protein [Sphingomonadales bacterium]|nr:thioredoxin family protein [Sphingomonadales bacterium]
MFLLAAAVPIMGVSHAAGQDIPQTAAHPEAVPYDDALTREAVDADVGLALGRAKSSGKFSIIVLGANWCHDSRALAGWFESERFKPVLSQKFELVFVDAGMPQFKGRGRNQHLVKRFGGKKQKNTPYVMILSAEGKLLNRDKARIWRNAASRSEDEIFDYFARFSAR